MYLQVLLLITASIVLADPEHDLAEDAFGSMGCTVTNPRIDNIEISTADTEYFQVKEIIHNLFEKFDQSGAGKYVATYPQDCSHVDSEVSGVYTIQPIECDQPYTVYCDMETDGGKWTVIQRRNGGSVGFNRGWLDYRKGFGSKYSEYWLGNEKLFWLTAQSHYELWINFTDFQDAKKYAVYDKFRVGDERSRYKLLIGSYSDGDAGDSLSSHNNVPFTTADYDNDASSTGNCARYFSSGWWFTNCYHANLNGIYRFNGEVQANKGIVWSEWRGLNISIQATEMKIRPA